MNQEWHQRITAAPIFQDLSPDYVKKILEASELIEKPGGKTLFLQGENPDSLHILFEGTVELRGADRDGRETLMEVVEPVDSFILAAVINNAPYLMSARTLKAARLLAIPARFLREEVRREPALSMMLLGALSRHYRDMVRQIKDLKLRSSSERIGSFLLSLARDHKRTGRVVLPYSKRLLSDRLNMTPENFSRATAQLAECGVRMEGMRVVIEDLDSLAEFCRLDPLLDARERLETHSP